MDLHVTSLTAARPSDTDAIRDLFPLLAEVIDEVFYVVTPDLNEVLYISPGFERVWGRPREAISHPSALMDTVHPQDRDRVMAARKSQASGGYDITYRIRRPDGRVRWVNSRAFPVKNPSGEVTCIAGVTRDCTGERTMAQLYYLHEAVTRGSLHDVYQESLTALADTLGADRASILVFDSEGVMRFKAWRGLSDTYRKAVEGHSPWTRDTVNPQPVLVPDILKDPAWAAYRSTFEMEGIAALGFVPLVSQKKLLGKVMLYYNQPHTFHEEEIQLATTVTSHIALGIDRKQNQENIQALNRDLEYKVSERSQELARSQEALYQAQKMEAVGRLAGGVAHDFNNLITGILGVSEELRSSFSDEDPRCQEIEEIIKAGNRAYSVTRQLLAFSRRQVTQPRLLKITKVIQDIRKMLQRLIGEDIRMEFKLQECDCIRMDPGLLQQVLMNLVVNARDAMPRGGRIEVRSSQRDLTPLDMGSGICLPPGPYVILTVSDNGCGMEPSTLSHIFEPFYTTKKDGGTGLGLCTVYGIIKQSGGDIAVASEPGKGTVFDIYFPVAGEKESPETPVSVPAFERGSETILVIEDEDIVRQVVLKKLRKAGYQVLGAKRGEEAVELGATHKGMITLVLTDVVMPDMNGPSIIAKLRSIDSRFGVLYMSGYPEEVIAHRGILEPGIDFLDKSLIMSELIPRVQQAIARLRCSSTS